MQSSRLLALALVAPALTLLACLFLYPLGFSVATAFAVEGDAASLSNFLKAYEFYAVDIAYTVVIVALATALIGLAAVAIGGYLVLGNNPRAVMLLKWLYRWPLFIPFVVALGGLASLSTSVGRGSIFVVALGVLLFSLVRAVLAGTREGAMRHVLWSCLLYTSPSPRDS